MCISLAILRVAPDGTCKCLSRSQEIKDETLKVHQNYGPGPGVRDSALLFLVECAAIQSLLYETSNQRQTDLTGGPQNSPRVVPKIRDYPRMSSATRANQAPGLGPDVCTT